MRATARWVANLPLAIILINQILHDTPRLEKSDLLAIDTEGIRKSRDALVGVDVFKPFFFLGVLSDVDSVGRVGEPIRKKRLILAFQRA